MDCIRAEEREREILQVYGKKNVCQEKAECGLGTCRNFVTAAVLAQRSKIFLKGTVGYMSECFHLDHNPAIITVCE